MYLPILAALLSARSASGFSKLTWLMQLLGFACFLVYPVRSSFPRSSYFEYTCLLAQSLVINCIIHVYDGVSIGSVFSSALGFVTLLLIALRSMPLPLAKLCAPMATALLSMSLLPQIVSNFASQTATGWSPVTALMALAGNSIRIFTTVKLASCDLLLLGQFGLGAVLNSILLLQIVFWGGSS